MYRRKIKLDEEERRTEMMEKEVKEKDIEEERFRVINRRRQRLRNR